MTNTRTHGYARISTAMQNADRQENALREYGIKEHDIYIDVINGNTNDRPQLERLLKNIRSGDLVVVTSIDRLGRDYKLIQEAWAQITNSLQADIVVLDMPLLDTRKKGKSIDNRFISDLVLQILSYVAQKERENIKIRQRQGIDNAKAKGKVLGRPKADYPQNWSNVYKKWQSGKITATAAMQELGLKRNTFYKLAAMYVDKSK
ncbi:MAG: recombinase family protein [Oscillospiraceae bacterium]|nr:recombinase family protein [Oscillospiraceae bacterium]